MKQALFILLAMPVLAQASSPSKETYMGRRVSQTLKFLSPLQSLTLFPKEIPTKTPRDNFLTKYERGLAAEKRAREQFAREGQLSNEDEYVGRGWEKRSEESEKSLAELEDKFVEKAYDSAIEGFEEAKPTQMKGSKYQFVGVVQPPNSEKKVKWYARKRPSNSKWNVRLLHVNKDVILRDMFIKGKIDVVAKYVNTGKPKDELKEGEDPSAPRRPLIEPQYEIKKRSVLNLWNFSPKHFFTDSSGAFWRERRLSPGLYTDGNIVYEQKYRFSDGKNGMKPISRLDTLLG